MSHKDVLKAAGLSEAEISGGTLAVHSPIDGAEAAKVRETTAAEMPAIIARSQAAFRAWRQVPAPRRGELVRLLGEELRASKEELGAVVTLEAGKILSEGLGEVQEMIDICDFAVGLSRQIYGLTIASERPGHRMMETWHPLGPCAVITAFNFPVAVWSWNSALALVCAAVLPAAMLLVLPAALPTTIAVAAIHVTGAFAARWLFFAEAEHVVGLYYGQRQLAATS